MGNLIGSGTRGPCRICGRPLCSGLELGSNLYRRYEARDSGAGSYKSEVVSGGWAEIYVSAMGGVLCLVSRGHVLIDPPQIEGEV